MGARVPDQRMYNAQRAQITVYSELRKYGWRDKSKIQVSNQPKQREGHRAA